MEIREHIGKRGLGCLQVEKSKARLSFEEHKLVEWDVRGDCAWKASSAAAGWVFPLGRYLGSG